MMVGQAGRVVTTPAHHFTTTLLGGMGMPQNPTHAPSSGQDTQLAAVFICKRCGWSGEVNGRPRCLPCAAARTAAWRKRCPEKAKALRRRMDKKARSERPAQMAAKKREKYARNREHYRAKYAARLEWLRAGYVTRDELVSLYAASNGQCAYCGSAVPARLCPSDPRGFDHVLPRSKGGQHTVSNLVVCCRSCNERKADRV